MSDTSSKSSPVRSLNEDPTATLRALIPDGLLFVREKIDALEPQEWLGLLHDLYGPGDLSLRLSNLYLVLPLLHDARAKNEKSFLTELFLPWVGIRRSLEVNRSRILDEFARTGSHPLGSAEDLAHLVNIYRNLVADLLDPYLTLLVACYQFVEGSFIDIENANFGQDERNKVEYLISRIKAQDPEMRILSGYDPIVRNAVSHSGSHGVTYTSDGALFRNIKRGTQPEVKSTRWTGDELLFRITRLFECILSIDAAVGVFGLDIVQQLTQDWDVHSRAIYFGSSAGHRAELRASLEKQISAIRHDEQLSPEKRFKMLADVFLHNCSIRQMPTKSIKFASSQKLLFIEVPAVDMNISDDKKVVNRAIEMTRYAILAQAVYGNSVSRYDVGEKDEKGREQLKLSIEQAVLDEYAEEQAGIVDLIHDAHIWLEGQRIGLSVDFDSLKEREDKLLGEHFPRRDR